MNNGTVNVFVACFHSQPGRSLKGCSGQYETVEKAIQDGLWPYDNGDDPSFFVARNHKGPLTWGVCRQNVRTKLKDDDIVVFISFTKALSGGFFYRICSVATVSDKLDHRHLNEDSSLHGKPYINQLIRAIDGREEWEYDENDRPPRARHNDWLWRITEHPRGLPIEVYKAYSQRIRANSRIAGHPLTMAENYVLFSTKRTKTYVCGRPPVVAEATNGSNERWKCKGVYEVLFQYPKAPAPRIYIRTSNAYGFAHPYIVWSMPGKVAACWRSDIIAAIEECSRGSHAAQHSPKPQKTHSVRC